MRQPIRRVCLVALPLFLLLVWTGCSRDARETRSNKKGDEYLAAGDLDKAEVEYLNALKAQPTSAYAISRLGILYFQQGRLSRAPAYLLKARELRPNDYDVRVQLGILYLAVRKMPEARNEVTFVLQHQTDKPDAPLVLAEASVQPKEIEDSRTFLKGLPTAGTAPVLSALALLDLRQQRFAEAEAKLHQAQAADANFAPIYSVLGSYYLAQKNPKAAGDAFAAAARLSPFRSPARFQLIRFNLQTGQLDEAKKLLAELTEKAPDLLTAWLLRAEIAGKEKKFDEALDYAGKVLSREAENAQALMLSARMQLAKGDSGKALAFLDQLGKLQMKSAELEYQYGQAYYAAGDLNKAADRLHQAVILSPKYADPITLLAEVNLKKGNLAAVVASLKPLVGQTPESNQAQLLLAAAYAGQHNFEDAFAIYHDLAEKTRDPQYWVLCAQLLRQFGRPEDARKTLDQILEQFPDYAPAIEQLVDLDILAHDQASARKRAEALRAKQPDKASSYLLLGKVSVAESDLKQAETAFGKAIELDPSGSIGYIMRGTIYSMTKDDRKALADFQQAAARAPKSAQIFLYMALTNERMKDYDAARAAYEKVLAIDPASFIALNNLACIYSDHLGLLDKALDTAQKANDVAPDDPHVDDTLGWILYKKGQYEHATTLLKASAGQTPDEPDSQYHLGMALYMMGDEDGASTALQRTLALDANHPEKAAITQRLAVLNNQKLDPDQRAFFEKALAADKNDVVSLTRLGAIYAKAGELDRAEDALTKVTAINPRNAKAALILIDVYIAAKKTSKAFEFAKDTRELLPNDVEVAHRVGRLAFQSGNYTWAVGILQAAARKQPDNAELIFDLARANYSIGLEADAEEGMQRLLKSGNYPAGIEEAQRFLDMLAITRSPAAGQQREIEQILQKEPDYVPALMALGASSEKQDPAVARQTYDKVLTIYSDFTPAMKRIAILASASGKDDLKAYDLGMRARESTPKDAVLGQALGLLAFRRGDYSRCVTLLRESTGTLGTTDPEPWYCLGIAQLNTKDSAGARESLQKSLSLGLRPDLDAAAKKALANLK